MNFQMCTKKGNAAMAGTRSAKRRKKARSFWRGKVMKVKHVKCVLNAIKCPCQTVWGFTWLNKRG